MLEQVKSKHKEQLQLSFTVYFNKDLDSSKFFTDELKISNINIDENYFPAIGDTWKKYLILMKHFVNIKKNKFNIENRIVTFSQSEIECLIASPSRGSLSKWFLKLLDLGYIDFIVADSNLMKLVYWITEKGNEMASKLPLLDDIILKQGNTGDIDKNIYKEIHDDYNYYLINPKDPTELENLEIAFPNNSKIDNESIEFDIPIWINVALFKNTSRWKLWLNLSDYAANQTSNGNFTSTNIMNITKYSNATITKALNRLVEKSLLEKEKRYSEEYRGGKNFYRLTDLGNKKAMESPTFNDMVLRSDKPIINQSLFRGGETWKRNLIVADYASELSENYEITSRLLADFLNVTVDSAGEYLKDLYEKRYLERTSRRSGNIHYYSYRIITKGFKQLNKLPSYKDILM